MPKVFGYGKEIAPRDPQLQMQQFAAAQVNQGMITMIDPKNLPDEALQLAKNVTVRFDRTSRRPGSILLVPDKPDTNPVLKLAFIKKEDGTAYTLRMTPVGAHILSAGAWTEVIFGIPLTGTVKDRLNTTDVLDTLIFSNNGADPIQTIDLVAQTGGPLGNAPRYRYITGFYNRAVGFARRDESEVEVGWSADGVATEWDPSVNDTAGSSPLLDSPADLSDFIKGGFGFTNIMVVLREKSIWLATKQPIPQNPFYFYSAVPGIGCDCPHSAIITSGGLSWVDRRTGTVYAYAPGSQPEPIGRAIEKTILQNVDDPETVFAAYAPIANEYTIFIPGVGSNFVQAWTYNFRNKAWAYNEYYAITGADDSELAVAGTTIDQLGDVPIDSLLGTIDDLSPSSEIITNRSYGRNDGSIAVEDINTDVDAPHPDFPDGIAFDTVLTSKTFVNPSDDIYIAKIVIEYQTNRGGTFKLEYSKNGGATDDSWKTAKIVTPNILGEPRLLIYRKVIKTRRFAWRLTTQAGNFEILSYEVHTYPGGESSK